MNYSTALVQLPLVREHAGQKIVSPADAHRVCSDMANLAQEAFHVLVLDAKNHLVNRHLITLGLADTAPVHPREVFRPAVQDSAFAVILAHNHPSGDCTPSTEDVRVTKKLVDAGNILGIRVLDHVIIGRPAGDVSSVKPPFLSMRESGLCSFTWEGDKS